MTVQSYGAWRVASDGWSWFVQRAEQPDSCESRNVWVTRASCTDIEDALGWLKWLQMRESTGTSTADEPSLGDRKTRRIMAMIEGGTT